MSDHIEQLDAEQASLKETLAKTQADLAAAKKELAAKSAAHTTMTDEHRRDR